jgi:hypothetical protein
LVLELELELELERAPEREPDVRARTREPIAWTLDETVMEMALDLSSGL